MKKLKKSITGMTYLIDRSNRLHKLRCSQVQDSTSWNDRYTRVHRFNKGKHGSGRVLGMTSHAGSLYVLLDKGLYRLQNKRLVRVDRAVKKGVKL